MKSIQYQLKLVEDNDGKCDCNQSPSTPSKFEYINIKFLNIKKGAGGGFYLNVFNLI